MREELATGYQFGRCFNAHYFGGLLFVDVAFESVGGLLLARLRACPTASGPDLAGLICIDATATEDPGSDGWPARAGSTTAAKAAVATSTTIATVALSIIIGDDTETTTAAQAATTTESA